MLGARETIRRVFGETTRPDERPAPASSEAGTSLTLAEVLKVANERNPTFAEFEAGREAARAEVLQARAYPNPELELSAGTGYGLELRQPIELPAKRRARRAAAEVSEEIVRREAEGFRTTLRADVSRAFHTVLYYKRSAALAAETHRIAQEIERVVARRVESGEAPEIDRIKARVETLRAARAVQAHQRSLRVWRAVLNTLCGRALTANFGLADSFRSTPPTADSNKAREIALAQHPTLRRLGEVVRQKQLVVQRERKAWYPDLTPGLTLGADAAVGALLGIELPLWYRNRGGIAAAQADLRRAEAELARTRQEIERDLETGVQTYESAREQLAAFDGGLRAGAAESLRIETFLYEQGETEFLQLLDARRTAQQTETEFLQALYDTTIARAELERAIGIGGEE
jgi:cobalt-zinc-cadmium efflux system outer membrane protein